MGPRCVVPLQKFPGERAVSFGAAAARVVFEDAFAETRRFAQANAARDDRIINLRAKMFAHLRHDLRAQLGSAIEHRHQDAAELEPCITPRNRGPVRSNEQS